MLKTRGDDNLIQSIVPGLMLYDRSSGRYIQLHGYLTMKSGLICPLFLSHPYMLYSLRLYESKVVMTKNIAGFIFDPTKFNNMNKIHKVKLLVGRYNKKVNIAICQYPSFSKKFEERIIVSFKLFL